VLTCLSQCPLSRTVVCVLTRAVSHHGVVCGCARVRAEQRRSLDLAAHSQKQPHKCSTFHRRHVTSQQWLSRTFLVSRLCLVQWHNALSVCVLLFAKNLITDHNQKLSCIPPNPHRTGTVVIYSCLSNTGVSCEAVTLCFRERFVRHTLLSYKFAAIF